MSTLASAPPSRRPRVLVVTRCFPNRVEPLACAFARQQLGCLGRLADVEIIAPIPYLPGAAVLGDRTRPGRLHRVPERDRVEGLDVHHPRVAYVPGLRALNAPLYLAALSPRLASLRGRFDVVLGTFLYPDGVAAAALARLLDTPLVLKAHGTDVNVVARWRSVRPMIRFALSRARFALGPSRPLCDAMIALGVPESRARVLPNGVDRTLFYPRDRAASRRELGLPEDGRIILFVGDVIREKGVAELVDAWSDLRRMVEEPVHLVLVGEGALAPKLEARARELGDPGRGRLILAGLRPLADVARHLGAADVFTLPSWAEGTPNAVLEALASARPVVATRVGGIPDVVPERRAGLLVMPRDVGDLRRALREALARSWDEEAILSAAPPSWEESAARLASVLREAAFG